jgi:hypothetical protein
LPLADAPEEGLGEAAEAKLITVNSDPSARYGGLSILIRAQISLPLSITLVNASAGTVPKNE